MGEINLAHVHCCLLLLPTPIRWREGSNKRIGRIQSLNFRSRALQPYSSTPCSKYLKEADNFLNMHIWHVWFNSKHDIRLSFQPTPPIKFWLDEVWNVKPISQFFFFFERQLFLRTNSKFQTPLTLTGHNSGSKHRSIENHHIFRFVRTSAFTWCSPCRVYEIRMSRKCGKHGKIPFFRFLSVPRF